VRAALNSVLLSACMAAGLTALVIILFLGNVRLSLIILAAIPLSIITAVLFIDLAGQTLNTMTLGGFALAIGILVDNGTVVIENIERHVAMREPCINRSSRRERGRDPDLPLDTVHLHRLRAGVSAAGHG
jgi:multidrug efflux pump subunit AcrB